MAEGKISEIVDFGSVDAELKALDERLNAYAEKIKALPAWDVSKGGNIKEMTAQAANYEKSLTDITDASKGVTAAQNDMAAAIKKNSDAEKEAAANRKKELAEKKLLIQEESANLRLQQIEIKKKQIAENEAAIASKKASADAVIAGKERILALKKEQEELEVLEEQEKKRLSDEEAYFSNRRGKLVDPITAPEVPFKPVGDQEDRALQAIQLEGSIRKVTLAQKENTAAFKDGTISFEQYKAESVANKLSISEYRNELSGLNREIKNQITLEQSLSDSQSAARAENKILTTRREGLSKTQDATEIAAINAQIDKNNELIDLNSDKLSKQKINIGNYPTVFKGAFTIVEKELQTVNASLASGVGNTEDLVKKQKFLQGATTTLASDYTTLTSAQAANKAVAQEFGIVYGKNDATFQSFSKAVQNGDTVLKETAVTAAKTGNVFQKAFGGLRTLANILPGVGIAGIVAFAAEPLINYVSKLFSVSEATKQITEENKKLEESLKSVQAQGISQQIQLEGFVSIAKNQTLSIEERNAALVEANKILGDHGEKLTLVNIATAAVTKQIRDFTEATIQQGIATKLADRAAELTIKQQDALVALNKAQKDVDNNNRNLAQSYANAGRGAEGVADKAAKLDSKLSDAKKTFNTVNAALNEVKDRFTTAQVAASSFFSGINQKKVLGIIGKLREELKTLNDQQPGLISEKDITDNVQKIKRIEAEIDRLLGKNNKSNGDKQIADLIKSQSTEFEIYKRYQELKIGIYKDELSDDTIYYTDKIKILDKYIQAEGDLLIRQGENQKQAAKDEARRQIENLQKDKTGKDSKQTARINQNIFTLEENLQQKILDINSATDTELAKLGLQRVKDYKKILDDRAKIEDAFHKQEIDNEQYTQDQIDKLNKSRLKRSEEYDKEDLKIEQYKQDQLAEIIKIGAEGAEDVLFKSLEAGLERRKEIYEDEKTAIDDRLQKQIDAINQAGGAEEDKEKRITAAQKQAQFEKEKIDQKAAATEKKLKNIKKLGAFAEIATNTAIAIADIERKAAQAQAEAALLQATPATAAFAPLAYASAFQITAQIPIVLAQAGVQLAALALYAKGTDNAAPGWAVVGEEGRELMKDRTGNLSLTPGTPTLMYMQGGEKITPHRLTEDLLNASAIRSIASLQQNRPVKANDVNAALTRDMLQELRWLNRKQYPKQVSYPIEYSPWYNQHFKS